MPILDIKATHNPHRWYLPVEERLCVGPPGKAFMFGGVGLAAGVQALQRTTGRPLIWATAHYLSFARPPSIVDLDVEIPAPGNSVSQARVSAHVGDKEIITVNAALGSRDLDISRQWVDAPKVPPPQDCAPVEHWRSDGSDLHGNIELRLAQGRYGFAHSAGRGASGDGRIIMWMRTRDGLPADAVTLAIFADHVPGGIGNALDLHAGGNSLDNTIRIVNLVETDWVLSEIIIHGIHGGFAHGAQRMFASDGTLMATGSQSMIVRVHEPPPKQ
ncbi:hypothetical protein sos41_04300 [Alphaproteobacteria bacterium SO-S41]|nr:hypothetical protein sos41_04300 [Alphaproteobacteria bacterium SO-S41]